MVERIKITPYNITCKDAYGGETFNTNNAYLKTDPSGQLRAGGYADVPAIYGSAAYGAGAISDHDNGWYPSDVCQGTYSFTDLYLNCPTFSQIKLEFGALPLLNNGLGGVQSYPYVSTYRSAWLTWDIHGNPQASKFRWKADKYQTSTGNESTATQYIVYVSFEFDGAPNPAFGTGGTCHFPYSNINAWVRERTPEEGWSSNLTFGANEMGATGYLHPIEWRNFVVLTLQDPINMSVTVTS